MRLSTVILPIHRWGEGQKVWQRAEDLGFHASYTYDHLSWRSFRGGPWFGAVPTLTAAATATRSMRLGTLVTSPNFRHPVPLAKELITLDDVSDGRITLGIGAGGTGFDATTLRGRATEPWSPQERAARFAEFVTLLDRLLTEPAGVTYEGDFYTANGARNLPGCVQRERLPFTVAATGPRGLRVAARHGQGWVTTGDPKLYESGTLDESDGALRGQLAGLDKACTEAGRDVAELDKVLLAGFTPDFHPVRWGGRRPIDSLDGFVDFAGRHAQLGFNEIVVHWPIPDSDFAADEKLFERIATEALGQL